MKTAPALYLVVERSFVTTTERAAETEAAGRRPMPDPLPWRDAFDEACRAEQERARTFELHRLGGNPLRSPRVLGRAARAWFEGVPVEPVRPPVVRGGVLEDGDGLPWPLDAEERPVEPV
jgi:hypothetical protein